MSIDRPAYVVLGGTGSVGSELVRLLLESGSPVVIGCRDTARGQSLFGSSECDVHSVSAEDNESIGGCISSAAEKFGQIAGVANCIGSVLLKPGHLTTDDEWDQTINVNLTSSFRLLRAAAKVMRKTGGSVVFVSSAAARIGLASHEAIAAAKAGIIGLTLSAAATYAASGIRVNAIAPGLVKSQMTRRLWESEGAAATSSQMHALGRLGEPVEIARAIAWLLDPQNSWITGQIIGVDGGLGSVLTRNKL